MSYSLIIQGRLPGLNEYIKSLSNNRYNGGDLKKETEKTISWQIKQQLRGIHIKNPVLMYYTWYEPNKKRDLDGISSMGRKLIQDALVTCGVLVNDGWKNIIGFSDSFEIDKANPRVEIKIIELED